MYVLLHLKKVDIIDGLFVSKACGTMYCFISLRSELKLFGNVTVMHPHFDYNCFELLINKEMKLAKTVFLLKKYYVAG